MNTLRQLHHEETMEALRRDFAQVWLNQEIQLRRMKFTPRQIHWAQRAAWLVFLGLYQKLDKSG